MSRTMRSLAWLALAVASTPACRKQEQAPPAAADVPPPPPAFVPGPMTTLEVPELGLRLDAPDNLQHGIDGSTLTLSAPGFPAVTIRVEHSEQTAASGGGGGCTKGGCSFFRDAPCRRIVCEAQDTGEFEPILPGICGSVQSTFVPVSPPAVRPLSTSGLTTNCDEAQVTSSQGLDPQIVGLLPELDACWKARAADNEAWKSGEVDVRLERAVTAEGGATYGLRAVLSGLEGDPAKLQGCIDALVAPLRGHLPAIIDSDCSFAWDHRFALARDPSCAAEATPSAAGESGDGGEPQRPREARARDAEDDAPVEPEPDAADGPAGETAPEPADGTPPDAGPGPGEAAPAATAPNPAQTVPDAGDGGAGGAT